MDQYRRDEQPMAYYDRLVRDPEAALSEIAERRNLSREELLRRLSAIRTAAQSGEHLTLGQANSFFDDDQSPPPALVAHVDACAYCQAMLDGLMPRRIEQGAERLRKEMAATTSSEPMSGLLAPFASARFRWAQPLATAAAGFVFAIAVVPNTLIPYFDSYARLTQVMEENAELRGTNAELRDTVDAIGKLQVALETTDAMSSSAAEQSPSFLPFGQPNWNVQGEWKVVSAVPNTIGGTSLQLTRTDASGPTMSSRELTPGDNILLLNLKKNARAVQPVTDSSAASDDATRN